MQGSEQWNEFRKFLIETEKKYKENRDALSPELQRIGKIMEDSINAVKKYSSNAEKFYPFIKEKSEPLAKKGWFISGYFGLSEILDLGIQCEKNSIDGLESIVCEMYRKSISEHLDNLVTDYPLREFAIRPATNAHLRGEYSLSIPLFFSQADGIIFNSIGKEIFSERQEKKGEPDPKLRIAA